MQSIIAGDIINSKQHDPQRFLKVLKSTLEQYAAPGMFQIYRGDSFQALMDKPSLALKISLEIKAALKQTNDLDVRIAIGLGEVTIIDNNIAVSSGTALNRSGVLLDSLKSHGQNLMVASNHPLDVYMNTSLKLACLYMDRWSKASATTVFQLLKNPALTQNELGALLHIKQATASRRLDRAQWKETLELLELFQQYYKDISNDHLTTH